MTSDRGSLRCFGALAASGGLLLAAVAAVYANALGAAFQLDDFGSIVHNPAVHGLGAFLQDPFASARPVANLVNALNYQWFGQDPLGYHVTNLCVHALQSLFVWRLLARSESLARGLASPNPGGWPLFAALLYAVHPVNTMAVTYVIQGRMAALAGLFLVASVWAFCRYAAGGGRAWAAGALALTALGLGTKENAALAPVLGLALDYFVLSGRSLRRALSTRGRFHAIWLGLGTGLGGMIVLGHHGGYAAVYGGEASLRDFGATVGEITAYTYLLTQFGVVLKYLQLILLPVGQSAEHYWPVATSFGSARVLFPLGVLAALAGAAVWGGRRRPLAGFGALWFGLTLLPESSFIPLEDVIFEHRVYLPLVGLLFVLVGAVPESMRSLVGELGATRRGQRAVALVAAVALIPLGAATIRRNQIWQTPLSLYQDAYRQYPEHPRVRGNLMSAYIKARRLPEALVLFESLPTAYREDPVVVFNVALAYLSLGRLLEARSTFLLVIDEPYAEMGAKARMFLGQIEAQLAGPGTGRVVP